MKKLLFLISIAALCFLTACCPKMPPLNNKTTCDTLQAAKDSSITIEIAKPQGQVNGAEGIIREATDAQPKANAIIHNAPEQAKTDSVKAVKTANKK